mmetsp:Transcript_23800/g.33282  ORF Transcript_23800/g.33282 Transcript_23800/m.33282 type:complete len:180 (+) Transcript_23800:129-668(+)
MISKAFSLLWLLTFLIAPPTVVSFVISTRTNFRPTPTFTRHPFSCRSFPPTLLAASVDVSAPSPEKAAEMGVRDWPQQLRQGEWEEKVESGTTLVRYVLDGKGVVETTTYDDNGSNSNRISVGPGSLVEVTGEAVMSWKASTGEMIILTPGFEEGGKLAGVALAMIVLCGALVAGIGSS